MISALLENTHPELFFGFVAPIGADVTACVIEFEKKLKELGYRVVNIKVTDIFLPLSKAIKPKDPLRQKPEASRYKSYISYGNQLRESFGDDSALAALTIGRVVRHRTKLGLGEVDGYSKVAYLLHQFKRKEEINLFRSIYGRQFFQISVYSMRGARVDYLSQKFANTANSANINGYRSYAEEIIQIDQDELDNDHGQKVLKIFHDADFIVNIDISNPSVSHQIERFCDLIFGSNSISPTKYEYGMFVAKAAALRTLDLSRQVGAAIFTNNSEIISMGSNEVPKGGGGTYWCDDGFDDREYVRKQDSNDRRKSEILSEMLDILDINNSENRKKLNDSQFMDALEYGRIIHAEMSAIMDAARLGRSTKGGIIYCTTFPCHMCAKHIVGSGISKVIFLEPYPKSLVLDLHSDSIVVEGNDRGRYGSYPSVEFEHFCGVAPRRYRELFERGRRKDGGKFKKWINGSPRPNLNIIAPYYHSVEQYILKYVIKSYIEKAKFNSSILDK